MAAAGASYEDLAAELSRSARSEHVLTLPVGCPTALTALGHCLSVVCFTAFHCAETVSSIAVLQPRGDWQASHATAAGQLMFLWKACACGGGGGAAEGRRRAAGRRAARAQIATIATILQIAQIATILDRTVHLCDLRVGRPRSLAPSPRRPSACCRPKPPVLPSLRVTPCFLLPLGPASPRAPPNQQTSQPATLLVCCMSWCGDAELRVTGRGREVFSLNLNRAH